MSFRIADLIGEEVLSSTDKNKPEIGKEELLKVSSTSELKMPRTFAQDIAFLKHEAKSCFTPVNMATSQKALGPFLNQSTSSKLGLSTFDDYASKLYSNMYYEQLYMPSPGFIAAANSGVNADLSSTYSSIYSPPVRSRWSGLYTAPPQALTNHPLSPLFYSPLLYNHYSKRKGGQVRFTTSQTERLEKRFQSHKYLSPEDRRVLAESLKLSDRQVKTWFQNRRAKWRRCHDGSEKNSLECTSSDSESEQTRCLSPDHQINIAN